MEKNNVTIALNVLYAKKEKIYPGYVSEHNLNREKQIILLMIPNKEVREWSETLATQGKSKERWLHYLAVKMMSFIKSNNFKISC